GANGDPELERQQRHAVHGAGRQRRGWLVRRAAGQWYAHRLASHDGRIPLCGALCAARWRHRFCIAQRTMDATAVTAALRQSPLRVWTTRPLTLGWEAVLGPFAIPGGRI